jgi:carbon storage regulator CsrA
MTMSEWRKESAMLSLQLKTGDYMTIGEDVVVQLDHISGDRCKLMIQAPKDMTILRGEVLERTGGERPECVFDGPRRHRQEVIWNRGKTRALNSIRLLLSRMDNGDEDVKTLRRQLDFIFPPEFASSRTEHTPK